MPIRTLRRRLQHGQIFWREVGRGKTVVLLHGAWCDGDQWSQLLPLLGQRYHCIAPDLVGFGESERLKNRSAYSIALQVNTLAELLSALRVGPVILIGHSLGAWVAAQYALQHPDQVQGLCVLAPEGIAYAPKRWRRERWLSSPLGGLWLAITKPFARKSSPGQPSRWLQNHHLRQLLTRHPAACRLLFQRRKKSLISEMVGSQLAALSIPMAVVQGDCAYENHRQLVQTFAIAAPNALLKILPGGDELPTDGVNALADFLEHWMP